MWFLYYSSLKYGLFNNIYNLASLHFSLMASLMFLMYFYYIWSENVVLGCLRLLWYMDLYDYLLVYILKKMWFWLEQTKLCIYTHVKWHFHDTWSLFSRFVFITWIILFIKFCHLIIYMLHIHIFLYYNVHILIFKCLCNIYIDT